MGPDPGLASCPQNHDVPAFDPPPDLPEQPALFRSDDLPVPAAQAAVRAATHHGDLPALAEGLRTRWGSRCRLGTSSWHFPGWAGQVWDRPYPEARLSRDGLAAYALHPLLRCVSLDRAFYRRVDIDTYQRLAAQTGTDFGFVVKALASVTDATLREPGTGAALRPNPLFLDPVVALADVVQPAVQGLGGRLGVLVFQLSPLPATWLQDPAGLLRRLDNLWQAVVPALGPARVALELRDPELLTPDLAASLKAHDVGYCLGLHDRMPPVEAQLPMLRALWPGPLVCRWNLQRGHRYAEARDAWAPFDRLRSPDLATRQALARVARAHLDAGQEAWITINNKAEGSAPASVRALAGAVLGFSE